MDKKQYKKQATKKTPLPIILKNIFFAFVIGGLICMFGQFLNDIFQNVWNFTNTQGQMAVAVTLIGLSALTTGLGLYSKLAKIGGGGTLVPITGFANAIVASAIEAKSEGLVLGVGAKLFTIAGPVLVYGISASIIYGLITMLEKIF